MSLALYIKVGLEPGSPAHDERENRFTKATPAPLFKADC